MLLNGAAGGAGAPMLDQLRSATGEAHARLEVALALLDPPLSRLRFVRVLEGFHRFHQAWEPRMQSLLTDATLLAPRRRLALIGHDLQALGAAPPYLDAPSVDLAFLDSASAAWGSLYVMEGSTLGGMVISKALRETDWAPSEGLTYFSPYGRRTAAMWAGFRAALEREAPRLEASAVIRGARATFAAIEMGMDLQTEATA